MKCPVCVVDLVIADRQGVEIDYCPQCRGVWLDRGELDKIIDRAVPAGGEPRRDERRDRDDVRREPDPRNAEPRYEGPRRDYRDEDTYAGSGRDEVKRKKRKNFLEDLFDFD